MRSTSIVFPLLMVPLILAPAHATVLIDVGDASLLPDSTSTLDVFISSDVLPSGELLSVLNFELRITPAAETTSTLGLLNPQTNAYDLDPAYLFFGNSAGPLRSVSSVSQPNDTLIGGDSPANFEDVIATSKRLLVRLEVDHQFAAGVDPNSTVGHNFTVDILPGANTYFWDPSFTPHSYSSNHGTVFVVPEPSKEILLKVALCCALILRRRLGLPRLRRMGSYRVLRG